MGLDNFWIKDDEVLKLEFDPPLQLCGGLFSAYGNGSFRGKVYADFFYDATGLDLYENHEPETVRQVADALDEIDYKTCSKKTSSGDSLMDYLTEKEFKDIKRMFRAYADAGARLHAWW